MTAAVSVSLLLPTFRLACRCDCSWGSAPITVSTQKVNNSRASGLEISEMNFSQETCYVGSHAARNVFQ